MPPRVGLKRKQDDTPAQMPTADASVIKTELAAIDKRIAAIEKRLRRSTVNVGRFGPGPIGADVRPGAAVSYEQQEIASELNELHVLRNEIGSDLQKPIEVDARTLGTIRYRAKELADTANFNADRAAGQGEHRDARRFRVEALRSRQIAEYEQRLRPSLRGY